MFHDVEHEIDGFCRYGEGGNQYLFILIRYHDAVFLLQLKSREIEYYMSCWRESFWKRFWNKQLEPNQDQTDATLVCIFRRTDVKRGSKIIQSSRPIHITATVLIRETNRLLETDETRRVVGQICGYITTTTASSVISDIPLDSVQQIVVVLTPSRRRVLLDVVIDVPLTDIAQSKLRSEVSALFHTTNAPHIKEWIKTHSSQLTNCNKSISFLEEYDPNYLTAFDNHGVNNFTPLLYCQVTKSSRLLSIPNNIVPHTLPQVYLRFHYSVRVSCLQTPSK